jgi:hypothetical protein
MAQNERLIVSEAYPSCWVGARDSGRRDKDGWAGFDVWELSSFGDKPDNSFFDDFWLV